MRTHEMFDQIRALDENQFKAVEEYIKTDYSGQAESVALMYDVPRTLLWELYERQQNFRQLQMARSYL